jgi:hypothetical protein
VEEFADFYFTRDLRWFARLLAATAEVVERMASSGQEELTHEERLQGWRNDWSQRPEPQSGRRTWLEGTQFMAQTSRNSPRGKRNSIRVTANKINHDRRAIFELWVPLWKAEIEHLKQQLSMRLAWPA